ncbi:carboxymuconolactone decarboxylase [Helicobacter saguini]|uniref:Carboxymuconolactone decarboxylase n=2 Tax=Helicobacter saguini TaxID=1548018 RepID=A0A347VTX9_9HELI|nr:carboxymuconolactone decarboxylase family protein [Helicobacter saguini]MWV61321.1 carboxymuconolactone decarboxylase [Helicobacter saguini]MWV68010.1 carboxymuconolactone decarboxylase [Helicobacter saguini]MWV70523.1 carboxymuconolactone decarboxylase [Helicobacter saguini]MWV72426.1 carboxymuconolactone decarboxylase [Helicobacter saguini]TLD94842.1 carboxymuconolactone decarboxylase family protein [Helicobacter saguini]
MKLTKNAENNFKKLFKSVDTPLKKSDPEFFTNYVNFAFDEVYEKSKILTQNERVLITLASLIASHSLSEFGFFLKGALNIKTTPEEIKEMIYQATPYIGLPRTLDFITTCNEIFKQNGIKVPLKPQGTTTRENRRELGLNAQREIFGEAIDKGNAAAPNDIKHIREFLSSNCFGDYYTRGVLSLQFRELLTFVYLLSFGGADSQVKAHIQGNLNMGNDREKLIAVITALIPYVGYPRSLNALAALDSIK